MNPKLCCKILLLMGLLSGCAAAQPTGQTPPPPTPPRVTASPDAPSPHPSVTASPRPPVSASPDAPSPDAPSPDAPSPTPTDLPTTLIKPVVQGASIGLDRWSPDSRWLPYTDDNLHRLHFYTPDSAAICDFPDPISDTYIYHFLAWLPDGRVVVQAAQRVLTGLPCGAFAPATAAEIRALDQQDPSFSPGGRYQAVIQAYQGSRKGVNGVLALKEVASGKTLVKTAFMKLAQGGGNLPGYWLDADHFLIPFAGDGPLLLSPGQPVMNVAVDIFHQPPKPGSGTFDVWGARSTASTNPPAFHLMLGGSVGGASQTIDNPLQIYHSETGQVETLPYLADQAHFSDDGHWLLVNPGNGQALLRSIDPPGSLFQPYDGQPNGSYRWSPDGSRVFGMPDRQDQLSVIWLYSFPQRTYLAGWQAPGYEMYPDWSPDGKYLSAIARLSTDYSQAAIFVIRVPETLPALPAAPAASPTAAGQPAPEATPAPTGEPGNGPASYCQQLGKSYQAPAGYHTYCDPDFLFAFDYPQDWRITYITGAPDTAASSPLWVRRAQRFEAKDMSNYIRADTYHLYGTMSLPERVQNFFSYADRESPEKSYSALLIGSRRAYAIINRWHQDWSAVYLFFQSGDYYTVMELKIISRSGLDTNWKIARSLQLPGTAPEKNNIPQELIDDSYQLVP